MGADAMGEASKADPERAAALRQAELDAAYRSAAHLGFDEIIDPRETRNAVLRALALAASRRQAPAEPVARTAIIP
jgi:acetyl-CoA carboxylase carboxyltransferase component